MTDIPFRSAIELSAALRRREIGSRELLDHYLDRIERLNSAINAVVTLDVERARQRANEADRRLSRGEVRGPLDGLPMTVKDTLETAGLRTTAGAPMLAEHVPATDAVSVARLAAAGAVIFGKTNTPLFAGDAQTYNAVFGVTNNPWDRTRSPGGSSGGSAAAVAAGLTGAELGSDIGGSIRNPAHYCGVYGLKPTHGVIPLRGHIPGPPGSLSEVDLAVVGPLARSADDLETLFDVLAGPDESRAVAWRLAIPPARRDSLREYRVAAWLDDPFCSIDSEVKSRLETTVEALRKAGVRVDDRVRPVGDFAGAFRCYEALLWPLMSGGMPPDEFERLAKLAADRPDDESPIGALARGATIRHRHWLVANEEREKLRASWREFFRDFDVLLCPTVPTAAIPHDPSEPMLDRRILVNGEPRRYLDQIVWTGLFNLSLLPVTVAPVGKTPGGLPVGVQIVGPYLEDRTTIDFARRLGDVIGGYERPPGF